VAQAGARLPAGAPLSSDPSLVSLLIFLQKTNYRRTRLYQVALDKSCVTQSIILGYEYPYLPPLYSQFWYHRKWHDGPTQGVLFRARVLKLKLLFNPWASEVNVQFDYECSFFDTQLQLWRNAS
jgi:hypothetical protein